jgi:uncharacterized membrane protein
MFSMKLPKISRLIQYFLSFCLIFLLIFSQATPALAARSGGRIGGGSFRAPTRTYSPSPRSSGGYGYGYPGGGMGFPFLIPLFGFGGGGLFTLLIFIAIAGFLMRSFSNASGNDEMNDYSNPTVAVAKVQVGLLANARALQKELDHLALSADMETPMGRAMVLQEASLALLRHPEYWFYGNAESYNAPLTTAESKFNQLSLKERSKFTEETLSRVDKQLKQADNPLTLPESSGELANIAEHSQGYIIVTLLAGIDGKLEFPSINDTDDLKRALQQIGSTGSDRLLAFEVLWTPQAEGDTLSKEDILAHYPDLKLV